MISYHPRRWWALTAMGLSVLVVGVDLMVLNVALPTLSADLGADTGDLQWIVSAYVLVFAALLLPAGLLGDRFGRKRLLMAGLVLFGLSSLVAAQVDTPGQLIAARAVMGVGAAFVMPLAMSVIPVVFPPEERSKAIAVVSACMAGGLPLGPIVGGYLLDHFWWGSIFFINVPVIAVALAAIVAFLPESKDPTGPKLDLLGGLLSAGGLVALIYGVIESEDKGWTAPLVLGSIGAGLVVLTAFVLWQRRAAEPLMDLSLFRDRVFLWGAIASIVASLALAGGLFSIPLYLQVVQGTDAMETGLRLIPMMAGLMVGGLASERLTKRLGLRVMIPAGLVTYGLGFGIGALTGTGDGYGCTALWLTVIGLGAGLTMIPAMDVVLETLPQNKVGVGSGLIQTLRRIGEAFGVAALGTLLSTVYTDRLDVGGLPPAAAEEAKGSVAQAAGVAARLADPGLLDSAKSAYVDGMDALLLVCALGSVAAAVIIAMFLPRRAPRRAGTGPDARQSEDEYAAR